MENKDFVWLIGEAKDKLPIDYEVMSWAELELPKKYVLNDDYFQNQGLSEETKYMCTAFSTTSWVNEVKHKRLNPDRYNGTTLGRYMVSKNLLDTKAGAYLKDAVKCAKDLGYINGWTLASGLESIKKALFNDKPIVVWSNTIDWKKTRLNKAVVVKWSSYWHAFLIVGYDDNFEWWVIICENSYWDKAFDNWRFYIKYSDIDVLYYSKFVLHIDDSNFKFLNELLAESKKYGYKDFYDVHIKHRTWTERVMGELAAQMRYIWKVNNKALLKLL